MIQNGKSISYHSPEWYDGYEAGHGGKECGADKCSDYIDGWLTGDAEKKINRMDNEGDRQCFTARHAE